MRIWTIGYAGVLLLGMLAPVAFATSPLSPQSVEESKTEAGQPAQRKEIIAVIEGQLTAFRSGDAQTAYSYAAPGIQRQFPDSDIFMEMVKNGYNVLRQPTQVEYQQLYNHFGAWLQMVKITDLNGAVFQAMYQMEQTESGEWKIGGCVLKPQENERI